MYEYEKAKSPVKISKIGISKGKAVIGPNSTITPVCADSMKFNHNAKLAKHSLVNLGELETLASWQLVDVKVCVTDVTDVEDHRCFNGNIIAKQKVFIKDETAVRPLFLYGEDINKVNVNQSYIMKNLRLRIVNGKTFLNTTKNDRFEVEKIDSIENLTEADTTGITSSAMIGRISGVNVINQAFFCQMCSKKGDIEENAFNCVHCGIKVLKSSCTRKWTLKLLVTDVGTNKFHILKFDNNLAEKLSTILNFEMNDEKELANFFLVRIYRR